MILDSSAIVAIMLREPGWERLVDKLAGEPSCAVGAPTLVETGIVLTAKMNATPWRRCSRESAHGGVTGVMPAPDGAGARRRTRAGRTTPPRGRSRA